MFGSRTTIAAVIALTLGALGVAAQTEAEREKFQACSATILLVNPQLDYSFEYTDPGFFNATYTYDPTKCDSTIPINTIKLTRYGADADVAYQCTKSQFDTSKSSIYSECTTITKGNMSTLARDGDTEWAISINYGSRAQKQVKEAFNSFVINPPPAEETPAPTPSGSFNRRRSVESQHKFDCPTGHTYCWTGERQEYACMDTSSDVTACGRCPYAAGNGESGGDCTSIEGADDVQCLRSKCVVNACERGFQVSLDRTKCLDGSKRSIMSRGILF